MAQRRRQMLRQLWDLGIKQGDVLMVHASLRKLGPIEDGADGVIEVLAGALGSTGTLIMLLGADNAASEVSEEQADQRHELLANAKPFNCRMTPASPEVGTLAEILRTRHGTRVNNHPDARWGVRGPMGHLLLAGLPWNNYYGAGSMLERFVNAGGKILRLGADLDTVTAFHYAEYLAEVPDKRSVVRYHKVVTETGSEIKRVETIDDSEGIVDYAGEEDYFATILKAYLKEGRATKGPVLDTTAEVLDAADAVDFATRWMESHFVSERDDSASTNLRSLWTSGL